MTNSRESLPLLTVDMDGVFCAPLLGWNIGIHNTFLNPLAAPPIAKRPLRWLGTPLDHVRFNARVPRRGAREALQRLRAIRRLVVVTGRRTNPRWWLRHHRFDTIFDDVLINTTNRSSPHYKLEAITRLGASEHIDDDPRTAQLLAVSSEARVFLADWPRSRNVIFDARVQRVRDLDELADHLGAP